MARNYTTSAIVDELLKFLSAGTKLDRALMGINIRDVLSNQALHHLHHLNTRSQQREVQRIISYMSKQQLISEDDNHNIAISAKGRRRIRHTNFDQLQIVPPKKWDKTWRMIFFDIPESKRRRRNALTRKLKSLGFYQLQRSVWVYPFPCRSVLETITYTYGLNPYTIYIEASHIDKDRQKFLIKKFDRLLTIKVNR